MYRRVLVSIGDDDEVDQELIETAVELAAAEGATLYGLYVIRSHPAYTHYGLSGLMGTRTIHAKHAIAQDRLEALEKAADRYGLDCHTDITKTGTPHRAIVAYGEEIGADVIVLGSFRSASIADLVLGDTAERVERDAGVDVRTVG